VQINPPATDNGPVGPAAAKWRNPLIFTEEFMVGAELGVWLAILAG